MSSFGDDSFRQKQYLIHWLARSGQVRGWPKMRAFVFECVWKRVCPEFAGLLFGGGVSMVGRARFFRDHADIFWRGGSFLGGLERARLAHVVSKLFFFYPQDMRDRSKPCWHVGLIAWKTVSLNNTFDRLLFQGFLKGCLEQTGNATCTALFIFVDVL